MGKPEPIAPSPDDPPPMREILTNVDRAIVDKARGALPVSRPVPSLFDRQRESENRQREFLMRFQTFANTLLGPLDEEAYGETTENALLDIQFHRLTILDSEIARADSRLTELAQRIGVSLK